MEILEKWKEIQYITGYMCSNLGNIKNYTTNRILKPYFRGDYLNIKIGKKCYYIHRIIATTWVPNLYNKLTVNHINGIKTDNSMINLEWLSNSEQKIHYLSNNRKTYSTMNMIDMIDIESNKIIKTFKTTKEASVYVNGYASTISKCTIGKQNSAYGYKWKYKDIQHLPGESWKRIDYSEYFISNMGRVKNKFNRLNKCIIKSEYYYHSIGCKQILTHSLVAKYFIGENKNLIINHIDGNKLNNKLSNLEYVTHSENTKHYYKLKKLNV